MTRSVIAPVVSDFANEVSGRLERLATLAADGGLDDAIALRIRQWPEQHAIHDAEDRRGRPDAEREREDRGEGERGAARQRAQRVAHVSPDGIYEGCDAHATGSGREFGGPRSVDCNKCATDRHPHNSLISAGGTAAEIEG